MSYKEILDNVSNIENLDNVTILKTLEKFGKVIKDFSTQQTGIQNLVNVEFEPNENSVTYTNGIVDYLGNLKITLADNIIVNKPCSIKFNIKGSETIIVDVDEFDNALEIHLDNDIITTLDFAKSEMDKSETDGAIVHKEDIEPNIITGLLLANYTLPSSKVYYALPLIKYNSVGTKLSINSSGGVVVGDGVSHVKVSASCPMTWGGYSGQIIVAIRKNSEFVHFVWAMQKGTNINTLPCSLSPIVIPVTSGDIITLNVLKKEATDMLVAGSDTEPSTTLTVEVVE